MKNYKTVTPAPINMRKMRKEFGHKHKLPKDFTFVGAMELFNLWGEFMCVRVVKVMPAVSQGVPRIFIQHPEKNKWVPAGRTAQAKF